MILFNVGPITGFTIYRNTAATVSYAYSTNIIAFFKRHSFCLSLSVLLILIVSYAAVVLLVMAACATTFTAYLYWRNYCYYYSHHYYYCSR